MRTVNVDGVNALVFDSWTDLRNTCEKIDWPSDEGVFSPCWTAEYPVVNILSKKFVVNVFKLVRGSGFGGPLTEPCSVCEPICENINEYYTGAMESATAKTSDDPDANRSLFVWPVKSKETVLTALAAVSQDANDLYDAYRLGLV